MSPPGPRPWALGAGPVTTLAAIVLILIGILALKATADLVVPVMFGLFLALVAALRWWAPSSAAGSGHPLALTIAVSLLVVVVLAVAGVIAFSVGGAGRPGTPGYEDRLTTLVADGARALLAQFGIVADPNAIPELASPGTLLALVRPVAAAVSDATIAIFVLQPRWSSH